MAVLAAIWSTVSFHWKAIGPLVGVIVGAVLGYFLSRIAKSEEWRRDNKLQEYREVLDALSTSYLTTQREHVQQLARNRGLEEVDNESSRKLHEEATEADDELFRILHDRIFIRDELQSDQIEKDWKDALENQGGGTYKLLDKYREIHGKVLAQALAVGGNSVLASRDKGAYISRLNGWQRLGIIASVLWAIGAGLATRLNDVSAANQAYSVAYNNCIDQKKVERVDPTKPLDFSECIKEGWERYQPILANSWENMAVVALVPIPFGWLLAYMFRGVWRWVRRGGF